MATLKDWLRRMEHEHKREFEAAQRNRGDLARRVQYAILDHYGFNARTIRQRWGLMAPISGGASGGVVSLPTPVWTPIGAMWPYTGGASNLTVSGVNDAPTSNFLQYNRITIQAGKSLSIINQNPSAACLVVVCKELTFGDASAGINWTNFFVGDGHGGGPAGTNYSSEFLTAIVGTAGDSTLEGIFADGGAGSAAATPGGAGSPALNYQIPLFLWDQYLRIGATGGGSGGYGADSGTNNGGSVPGGKRGGNSNITTTAAAAHGGGSGIGAGGGGGGSTVAGLGGDRGKDGDYSGSAGNSLWGNGAPGGLVIVICDTLLAGSANGFVSADGVDGGDGGTDGAGGFGGGQGGGGGGLALVMVRDGSSGVIPVVTAADSAGGAAGGAGAAVGGGGNAGMSQFHRST